MKDQAIFEIISNNTDISNIVSDNISPVQRPQDSAVPAMVYRRVFSTREYSDDGEIELIDQSYDLFAYAETYSELESLISAIETLSGTKGTFAGEQLEYITVEEIGDDDYLEDSEIYTGRMELKFTFRN